MEMAENDETQNHEALVEEAMKLLSKVITTELPDDRFRPLLGEDFKIYLKLKGDEWSQTLLADPNATSKLCSWVRKWKAKFDERSEKIDDSQTPQFNHQADMQKIGDKTAEELITYAEESLIRREEYFSIHLIAKTAVALAIREMAPPNGTEPSSVGIDKLVALTSKIHFNLDDMLRPGAKIIHYLIRPSG